MCLKQFIRYPSDSSSVTARSIINRSSRIFSISRIESSTSTRASVRELSIERKRESQVSIKFSSLESLAQSRSLPVGIAGPRIVHRFPRSKKIQLENQEECIEVYTR